MSKHSDSKRDSEAPVELESQFILRLPAEPAKAVREAIRSGSSTIKDRLFIKLENDMRYGEVRMDHWLMNAKLVDLPTIIESLKTIDGKNFYKTADICQLLVCKEEDDQTTDEESPAKKKKDPHKVDKKFLWPHGVTPPLKNVRKRRFRKTLKKKYVEAPEIEKEVKRLLRVDNEAVKVTWEVINEEDDKPKGHMKEGGNVRGGDISLEASNQHSVDVAERDIFGEAVSDSDEDETNINTMGMDDDNSRLSADDTMDSSSLQAPHSSERGQQHLVTQFTREMFGSQDNSSHTGIKSEFEHESERDYSRSYDHDHDQDHSNAMKDESTMDYDDDDDDHDERPSSADQSKEPKFDMDTEAMSSDTSMFEQRRLRKEQLEAELPELKARCQQQELEISNLENQALRQRFQEKLDNMLSELLQKEQEYQELSHE